MAQPEGLLLYLWFQRAIEIGCCGAAVHQEVGTCDERAHRAHQKLGGIGLPPVADYDFHPIAESAGDCHPDLSSPGKYHYVFHIYSDLNFTMQIYITDSFPCISALLVIVPYLRSLADTV